MKKNKRSKKAKFFCEFCGSEVKQNDKICTYCGKFFASVRCPNCGKTGRTEEFTNGCPDCGYAVTHGKNIKYKNNNSKYLNSTNGIFQGLSGQSKKNKNYDGSLPAWMYFFVVGILLIMIICLYSCLQK